MSWILRYAKSSIGKKQIMALTGLGLCGFLVAHLLGNLLIFVGPDAFNIYGHTLTSNPLIYVAELGLLAMFGSHIALAVKVVSENNNARPQKYYYRKTSGRGSTFASYTMPYTGLIILVFLVLHILHFKYGTYYTYLSPSRGIEIRDLHRLVIETFQSPLYSAWYVFAQAAMGLHVAHGLQSAISTLGIFHPRYSGAIKKFSIGFAVVVAGGFASIPIWVLCGQGGN